MNNRAFETLVGFIVLVVAVMFMIFAYRNADIGAFSSHYKILAKFETVDGLTLGSDVRIGGIKVGIVSKQLLDPETYNAVIEMSIDDSIAVPKDSTAQVVGDGLLGGKYVSILPGADETRLKTAEYIKYTQSAVNFETLLGKFIFGGAKKEEEPKKAEEKVSK